ncbi:hypothetical protein NOK75_17420 [Vibrio parahaemolyticus]|uniref:hypothetical protein n=1 Tax=Vibrio parahaemolyticus TaxID=670 RepID=UPI00226B4D11|nr:hypothetical protein [Vibrio parahaemolyticus]MCX8843661.1 hypothetical protein [Vibrio parahaemolyticus]HCG7082748.1 hypothetical protein [Vibrio parahaemolyticus]
MSFCPPLSVRWYLHNYGWKRGSFIELDGNHALVSRLPLEHQSKIYNHGYSILITLYDCALINNSFTSEPDVGYALVSPIDKVDKRFANAKNERVLQFQASSGSKTQCFEIKAGDLGHFDRALLLNAVRSLTIETTRQEQQIVGKWISRRTTQPTYPDAFNYRVDSRQKEKLFKNYSESIAAFYIRISPKAEELDDHEEYSVSIIAAVEDDKIRTAKREKLDDSIHMLLKKVLPSTKKLKLESFELIAESQITLGQLRHYVQWADEYFSYRNNPYSALPVQLN